MRRWTALGLFAVGLATPAMARVDCANYAEYLHWSGGVWTRAAFAIEIAGPYAYLADGPWGFTVVDIADPTRPQRLASIDMPDAAVDLALAGKRAYVVDGLGMSIFDLTLPAEPALFGRVSLPPVLGKWEGVSISVADDLVFVLRTGDRWVIDVRDPANPFVVATELEQTGARDVEIQGNYLYSLSNFDLTIYDIADPIRPRLTGSYAGEFLGIDLCVSGGLAYVVGDAALLIFDVAIPWRPLLLSSLALNEGQMLTYSVDVSGTQAVVVTSDDVVLVDVADPRQPRQLGRIDSSWTQGLIPTGVAVASGHAFLTHLQPGLVGVSAGRLSVLALSGERVLAPLGPAMPAHFRTAVAGSTLYGAGYPAAGAGLWFSIFDASDPAAPAPLGSVDLGLDEAIQCAVALVDQQALVVHRSSIAAPGLILLDVSDPANPSVLDRLAGDFWDVATDADRAVIAQGAAGLAVLDRSNPSVLALAGAVDTPGAAWAVELSGSTAYVADGNAGVSLVDLSDPLAPLLQTTIPTAGTAQSVAPAGELIWVADGLAGLTAIALSGPGSPTIVGSWRTAEYLHDVQVRGQRAYVMEQGIGLHVLDIAEPSLPQPLGGVPVQVPECGPNWATLGPQSLYLTDTCLGVLTYPLDCDDSVPVFLRAFEIVSSASGRRIRWSIAGEATNMEFRLVAETSGAQRSIDYTASVDGEYVAWDPSPSPAHATATLYSLFARTVAAPWSLLAQERAGETAALLAVQLHPARPNPFNPSTTIAFELPEPASVALAIFDLGGRRVRTLLAQEPVDAGSHRVEWDGSDDRAQSVGSGVYVCRLQAGTSVRTQRLTLLQ